MQVSPTGVIQFWRECFFSMKPFARSSVSRHHLRKGDARAVVEYRCLRAQGIAVVVEEL